MKKDFTAIFLDNDGILVDTEKFYAAACDEISRDLFGLEFPLKMYQEYGYTKGIGITGFLREQGKTREKILEFQQLRDKQYEKKLSRDIFPLSGVIDFLETCKSREILTACVTATPLRHFLQIHNRTGLLPYLKFWITNENVAETKPSPEGYLLAAEKVDTDPANCLVIEDSPRGIKAGKTAGMTVYAIPTEQTKNLDLSMADKVFTSFEELMNFN